MPDLHDRRVIKCEQSAPYWQLQEYMPCGCPDCEEDAHWVFFAGSPSRDEAREWQQDIDGKSHELYRPHDAEATVRQGATS